MNTQANKPLRLPLLIGGIAAILVSGIAIGSMAISAKGTNGPLARTAPPEMAVGPAITAPSARTYRCAECGVIESTREIEAPNQIIGGNESGRIAAGNPGVIEATLARSYEITIRLRDGSRRVITDAHPARWRRGERVQVIAGAD